VSKVLIKAQTTLDEYGAELPPKRQPPISPEEQEFNFDRAVDASSASSLEDIYNQPHDSSWAGEMIDSEVSDARQQIARDLLQAKNPKHPNYKELLESVLEHETQTGADGGIEALPESLRQYYSRQSTLPEHMPTLHTPNWQMEDGSIRPGSIPAINAVRRMGTRDIDLMMQGAGLVPVHNKNVHSFEEEMIPDPEYRFDLDKKGKTSMMDSPDDGPKEVSQNELGFFASPNNKIDVGRAQMEEHNHGMGSVPQGYVGIRGLNTKDDKLQMRPPIGNPQEKNTEGLVQSRIPPSRLVPIRDRGHYPNRSNILYGKNDRERFGGGEPMSDSYRNQVDSVFNEYPEVWNDVKMPPYRRIGDQRSLHNLMGSNLYENSTPPSWGDSGRENPMVGVTPRAIENILNKPAGTNLYDFNRRMDRHQKYLKRIKKEYIAVDSSREAPAKLVELQNGDYAGKPEACTLCGGSPVVVGGRWKNPLGNIDYTHHLCEPCADQYDVMHSANYYKSEDMFIGDVLVKNNINQLVQEHQENFLNMPSPMYQMVRVQPAKYNYPARARDLMTNENVQFRDKYNRLHGKGNELPLSYTKEGTPNYERSHRGRFGFPAEAYSFNPHTELESVPDVPNKYKTREYNAPSQKLHMYGYKDAPQAFGTNIQDEGILYGDLDEDKVERISTKPFHLRDLTQASQALLPSNRRIDLSGYKQKIQDAARMLMENSIPSMLLNQKKLQEDKIWDINNPLLTDPTSLLSYHDPFQQWTPAGGLNVNTGIGVLPPHEELYRAEPMSVGDVLVKELNADLLARNPNRPYAEFSYDELMEYIYGDMESGDMTLNPEERAKMFEELNIRGAENQQEPMRFSNEFQEANKAVPMSVGDVLVKRQTTLSAYDPMQIESNLEPQNSNIFIAAKPGNQDLETEELSRLSDEMLAEIAALKQKHGEFGITSATGNAEWKTEPSFMLTNVPDSARQSINDIAARFGQDAIGVSEKDQAGADFITPQGEKTDSFEEMAFEDDPMYSTDFPTGQRLTFKGEAMKVGDVLVKERISPEAIAHKLEYDKKYESNPVRVKYREDLNRERRKRHIYGQGGPDMSHTSQHTIVPEDPHTNRARHFKSKGTLL
jgi:hypothetical protein